MKKFFALLTIGVFLVSCGGKTLYSELPMEKQVEISLELSNLMLQSTPNTSNPNAVQEMMDSVWKELEGKYPNIDFSEMKKVPVPGQ